MEKDFKGKIVDEYLTKYPKTSNASLARIIYKENKGSFENEDSVRSMIRYRKGSQGDRLRLVAKKTRLESFNPENIEKLNKLLEEIPEGIEENYENYVIPTKNKNILVINDIHVPFHNKKAVISALQYGIDNEVDTILINGDLFDFYRLSFFQIDPRKRRFKDELQECRDFLKKLREIFPTQLIIFKEGNHEERWTRFLMQKATELFGIEEFELPVILRLAELNIQWVADKRIIQAGKLNILHGHEYRSGFIPPVNIARGYYLRAKENIMVGHHHQTSEHSEASLNGSIVGAWSVGCLSELHPNYMPLNKWNLGFAHVKITTSNGDFTVINKKIINGKIA